MTLRGSTQPLSAAYDAALVDLDGVVYIGGRPVQAAPVALAKARATGMATAFVTNNASRTPAAIAERLTDLGIVTLTDEVVTSAQAGAQLLAERLPRGAPVLVVGDMGLRMAVHRHGLRPVTSARETPHAVIQGYSSRLAHDALREACLAMNGSPTELPFIATNGDTTVPTGRGPGPGNGSFSRVIAAATGHEPLVAGKPHRPLHDLGAARTAAHHPIVVGDRLDTDILGAHRRGSDSLLVLSGVTTPTELVLAEPELRPSYISADLSGLTQPHPVCESGPQATAHCGGWTVRLADGKPTVHGGGNTLDGVRALCSAVWADAAPPPTPAAVREVLGQLGQLG